MVYNVFIAPIVREFIDDILKSYETGRFNERGGSIFGTFDGKNAFIQEIIEDTYANSTSASINFSYYHYRRVLDKEKELKNLKEDLIPYGHYVGKIGTWHTHPPGYGANYSYIDEKSLFFEWMILSTDDPSEALKPLIHIIGCRTEPDILKVFTMSILSEFEFKECSEKDIDNINNKNIAIICKNSNGRLIEKEYLPWFIKENEEQNTLRGVRISFNYPTVPLMLEKIILENFFLKKPKDKRNEVILYIRHMKIQDSYEYFKVKREKSSKNKPYMFENLEWSEIKE